MARPSIELEDFSYFHLVADRMGLGRIVVGIEDVEGIDRHLDGLGSLWDIGLIADPLSGTASSVQAIQSEDRLVAVVHCTHFACHKAVFVRLNAFGGGPEGQRSGVSVYGDPTCFWTSLPFAPPHMLPRLLLLLGVAFPSCFCCACV